MCSWKDERFTCQCGALAVTLAVLLSVGPARANETDQFTLPPNRDFVDLGDLFTLVHYQVLQTVVESVNERIDRVHQLRRPEVRRARLDRLHDPGLLADMVRRQWGPGFFETLNVEDALRSRAARDRFDHSVLAYHNRHWIYEGAHLPIDPRNVPLLIPSSTIRVYDVYFGTDKIGHFHDLGHIYYKSYLRLLRTGQTGEEAMSAVVKEFSEGIISEASFIGALGTGVYSNADLAANYLGMRFYQNLTEPVMLRGRECPPLLVRFGDHWRLNFHVRPESDFFRPFISDHLNEALNPSVYEWGLRGDIKKRLEEQADRILEFYADQEGHPRPRSWFVFRAHELVTYWGEDYGHSGIDRSTMVMIADACFSKDAVTAYTTRAAAEDESVSAGIR